MKRNCVYCGTTEKELRPYGPGGQDVCFECAFGTPERKRATEQAFLGQLGMAGPTAVIDSSEEAGPRAATPAERAALSVSSLDDTDTN